MEKTESFFLFDIYDVRCVSTPDALFSPVATLLAGGSRLLACLADIYNKVNFCIRISQRHCKNSVNFCAS